MKSFDISYFIRKKSSKTLKSGGEKVQNLREASGFLSYSLKKRVKIKSSIFILTACLMVAFFMGLHDYVNSFFHVVYFEGKEIGLVKEVEEVESLVDDIIEAKIKEYEKDVFSDSRITFSEANYHFRGLADIEIVRKIIDERMTYFSWAYLVFIDGKPIVHLECEEDLNEILETIKLRYMPTAGDVKLLSMEWGEKISGKWVKADPEDIRSLGEGYLVFDPEPSEKRIQLASRGERQSRESDTDDGEISDGNILENKISLTVLTVEEEKEEEEIPFETRYVYNDLVESGKTKTLNEGVNGKKEITYHISKENGAEVKREKVETEIVSEPKERVIEQGTKVAFSGRSSAITNYTGSIQTGTGQFIWPVPASYDNGGRITRGFAGGHAGVDIHASTLTATPIVAADTGTVVFCQYNGGYGNTVVINHGNYYTLYAHNSSHVVSVGDDVSKGSVIAYMGNTGQTFGRTGIHLHFEIRVPQGGWQQSRPVNPMNFY